MARGTTLGGGICLATLTGQRHQLLCWLGAFSFVFVCLFVVSVIVAVLIPLTAMYRVARVGVCLTLRIIMLRSRLMIVLRRITRLPLINVIVTYRPTCLRRLNVYSCSC